MFSSLLLPVRVLEPNFSIIIQSWFQTSQKHFEQGLNSVLYGKLNFVHTILYISTLTHRSKGDNNLKFM